MLVQTERHIEALNPIPRDEFALELSDEQSNNIDSADNDNRG